jgi:hypothetical protein
MKRFAFAICLGALLAVSAGAQDINTSNYADVTGVHGPTDSRTKECPVNVADIQSILEHQASNEVLSYKWIPVCDIHAWGKLQGKFNRLRDVQEIAFLMPDRGGLRLLVDTSNIIRDPQDGIVFVNVHKQSLKDVRSAISSEVVSYNQHPHPPRAAATMELAKGQ